MTKDEAMMRLTLAYGHNPAVADFNIVAVNHVLDSLIQAEREACAKVIESHGPFLANGAMLAEAIRARGQA